MNNPGSAPDRITGIMNLLCQGALRVGWTGLGWATRLWAGSYEVTPSAERAGWGRQVIIRTAPEDASAGLSGQTPPGSHAACGRCLKTWRAT
jgi:hypothetical protein